MTHGEHFDSRGRRPEEDGERETGDRSTANRSSIFQREPLRRFLDLPEGKANGGEIARPEADLPRLVPRHLVQVLGFSTRVELKDHFSSVRAFASTSSAGVSVTSPRSI